MVRRRMIATDNTPPAMPGDQEILDDFVETEPDRSCGGELGVAAADPAHGEHGEACEEDHSACREMKPDDIPRQCHGEGEPAERC